MSLEMSKTEEPTVREIVNVMKDVAIEVDVYWILGPDSQGLATWGDVSAYMKSRVQHMDPDVVQTIKDKLRHEYHIKVLQMEVKEVPREPQSRTISGAEAPITEETTPSPKSPELPPHREYRTPWDPTDHGAAMRKQILGLPPPDPWNPS